MGVLLGVVDDFQALGLELKAKPKVVFVSIVAENHEACCDLRDGQPGESNHLSHLEGREVPLRHPIADDALELGVIFLVGGEELDTR